MTTTFASIDDLRDAAGRELGFSRWFEMSQRRIDAFAETTEDRQWIHVDPVRAATGPFGGPVAHGFLTLSLIAPVLKDVLHVPSASASVNYGLDRVRFPSHTPVGSRVRGSARVETVTDVAAGLQLVIAVQIEREGGEKPLCVADCVIRVVP